MTRPFSVVLKQQMVARLTGVNAVSAAQLARETGISQQNLSRWLCEARNSPLGALPHDTASWTVVQKARVLANAAGLSAEQLTAYLQREGVKPGYFRRWRGALEEAGEESVGMTKQIRALQRELARKDRALAAAAALLLLRETIDKEAQTENEFVDDEIERADATLPA
jgi:transposase-like protein